MHQEGTNMYRPRMPDSGRRSSSAYLRDRGAGLLGAYHRLTAAELLETTKICFVHTPSTAPRRSISPRLRLEGLPTWNTCRHARNASRRRRKRADLTMGCTGPDASSDAGKRIVLLAGVHSGCTSCWQRPRTRSATSGKTQLSSISGAETVMPRACWLMWA
jgi:hypothetical protein